jgi:murein DD-endopeptidase MepM/ murein hydrolase activator NlpD
MKAHEFLTEAEDTKSYEIKPGDTLTKIASKNSTTIDAIMDLNRGNRAIRDRDTIYAGGTIKIPTTSTGFDADARVKRQGATDVNKPDAVAKIGNQEFPLTKGPGAPGANDDMGGKNFGIDDTDWESPTDDPGTQHPVGTVVKLDWSKTPYRDLGPLVKKPDGSWYTLDGKNRATDKKIISMAEKASPVPKSSSSGPRSVPGGGASNVKLPTRPDQLRPEANDISPVPDSGWTNAFGEPRGDGRHEGIDLRADIGTPVVAPNSGKVLDVGYGATTGTYLTLGDMQNNKTHRFMHLSKTLVDQGEIVKQGQVIAKSGNSGFNRRTNKPYAPHLHWEKWINGEPVDPAKYVDIPRAKNR